ncbi:MAG: tyrosine-type recombinase/integrase [Thermoplasmatota archaeon]
MTPSDPAKARKRDTVPQLLEDYENWMIAERGNKRITVDQMLQHTKEFLNWLNDHDHTIDNVNQSIVNRYVRELKEHYSANTLVPITANLRKLLMHFLCKDVTVKMAPMVPPKRDKTTLTQDQIEAILKAADTNPLAHAVIATIYYGCLRSKELRNLDLCDVDFEAKRIVIRHPKGNDYGIVNITKRCADAIKRYLKHRPQPREGHENALFVTTNRTRISSSMLGKLVKTYAAEAGIEENVYPHKFRISCITHMAEHGYGVKDIQPQSRHRDAKILLGYVQSVSARQRQVYDDVFEEQEPEPVCKPTQTTPGIPDDDYEKLIVKKYLDGDIDRKTMNSMLKMFEDTATKTNRDETIAYG